MQFTQHILLSTAIFLCLSINLKGETPAPSFQSNTDSLRVLADQYLSAYKIDQAIILYNQLSKQAIRSGDIDQFLFTKLKIGSVRLIQLDYTEALRIADSVYSVAEGSAKELCKYEATLLKADIAGKQRKWQDALKNLDQAEAINFKIENSALIKLKRVDALIQSNNLEFAQALIERSKNIYDSLGLDYELARAYFYQGLIHTRESESDLAIEALKKAKQYYKKVRGETHDFLSVEIDTKLGVAYHQLGLYSNAIEVFNGAIRNAKAINPSSRELVIALNSLTRTYLEKPDLSTPDLEIALATVNEGLKISKEIDGPNGHYTALCYQTRGRVFLFYGDYNQAIDSYDKAAQIVETHFSEIDARLLSMIIYSKGVTQTFNQQVEEGLKEMGRSLEIALTIEQGFEKQIIDRANYLAVEFVLDFNNPDIEKALKYYHMAVKVNSKNFNSQEYNQNPEVNDVLDYYQFFRSLMGKVYTYILEYRKHNAAKSLENAYNTLELAESVVDKLRASPMSYEDQLNLSKDIAETLHFGVNVGFKLYELEKDKKYAEFAFRFFEKSKANQALYNMNVSTSTLGIPQNLLGEEKEIRSGLTSVETLLFHEEKKGQSANPEKVRGYRSEVNKLNDQLVEFKNKIRQEFPSYFTLKFDNVYAQIEDIQNSVLDDNEVLISYNVKMPDVYSIKVDKAGFEFKFHPYDSTLKEHIEAFNELVQTPSTSKESISQYIALSDTLTSVLIGDAYELSKYSKITIIPDGILHSLPFELLLTDHKGKETTFGKLPYRVKSQAVHYAQSVTALMRLSENHSLKGNKVLAYAPLFDESIAIDKDILYDSIRAAAGNLAYTQSELTGISKHFEVVKMLDRQATERSFRENVSKYPIIHVASHGILDPIKTIYSKLLFSPFQTDSLSDGYLNMREILTLDIPAKMVVLSACNTGSGEIIHGEGVLSIANGFFYAGAKSVVTTLWTANDQSTAKVMESFYENLSKSQAKSEALRNAKLTYMEQTDGLLAHPYYWGHFTVNGDDSPIVESQIPQYLLLLIIIGVIALGIIVRKKKTAT